MRTRSDRYTYFFALTVCAVCSFLLALVSQGLRPRQELNAELDVKKNILKAVRLQDPLPAGAPPEEVLRTYKEKIEEIVVDAEGRVVPDRRPEDIRPGEALYPVYVYEEGGKPLAYCFPISGKGLWSTLYGYLAMERDAVRVRGITFYKHGETPGLGAEIEKPWFQENFRGKTIWDASGRLAPIRVVKGKASVVASSPEVLAHSVDGISGATMTSQGVTALLDEWLHIYEPYLRRLRAAERD